MSKTRDALVAVGITAVFLSGWAFENYRPRPSHAGALQDLYASPVCLRADGRTVPGGLDLAAVWRRTMRLPIDRAGRNFIGSATIELVFAPGAGMGHLTFVRVAAHRWRPNEDVATTAWLARACAAL